VSILNPLFQAVAWVITQIHAGLAVPFGATSGWAWGLSIVILVMLMRLIMVPLFVKQVRAQRRMAQFAPQLQELRKRYKNDKQKLNEEMMKFYKENGVNPLAGCWPLAAQLPVFWSLFNVLRAIASWSPGHTPQYGIPVSVVQSALHAHIFGALLSDKFLFAAKGEPWSARLVILLFVAVSASTTFLTMRQSQKRGMMQQPTVDPDNPMANTQKYMMYIAPFFALTGLYWQFGLVIYWVTTNLWTLGQQHFLLRNMPVVGSTPAGAATAPAQAANRAAGPNRTASSLKKGTAAKPGPTGKAAAGKGGTTGKTGAPPKSGVPGKANGVSGKANGSGQAVRDSQPQAPGGDEGSSAVGAARALLRRGKKAEPEEVTAEPETKVVRQQPVRQSRSKRSGKR
jgi:YidC/Oxa1 family membrane protein insertase